MKGKVKREVGGDDAGKVGGEGGVGSQLKIWIF